MDVYWLEQSEEDVPSDDCWLSPGEAVRLQKLRFAKRRTDWRLGRWTAKCAVVSYLDLPDDIRCFSDIEIRAAASGAPEVHAGNKLLDVIISISHRAHAGACAISGSDMMLGCDLELVERRSPAFVSDYFSVAEQALVARTKPAAQAVLTTLLWSAKESALKLLRTGLRQDTLCVEVTPPGVITEQGEVDTGCGGEADIAQFNASGWHPLQVRYHSGQIYEGWWQHTGGLVRTLLSSPATAPPLACKKLISTHSR